MKQKLEEDKRKFGENRNDSIKWKCSLDMQYRKNDTVKKKKT